jgi:hypothetical protein
MSRKYEKYVEHKKHLGLAKKFVNLLSKRDSQSGTPYSRLSSLSTDSLQLCGQAYAGAKNYHEPNKEFIAYINNWIKKHFDQIVLESYSMMEKENEQLAIDSKDDLLDMLKFIELKENNG